MADWLLKKLQVTVQISLRHDSLLSQTTVLIPRTAVNRSADYMQQKALKFSKHSKHALQLLLQKKRVMERSKSTLKI